MNNLSLALIFTIVSGLTFSCKKEKKSEPVQTVSLSIVATPVPSDGDFVLFLRDHQIYWTRNFVDNFQFLNLKHVNQMWRSGDTLLFTTRDATGPELLYYGSVYRPEEFRALTHDFYYVLYAHAVNGVITGNAGAYGAFRRFHCDTKVGASKLEISDSTEVEFKYCKHNGQSVVAVASFSSQLKLIYTKNGIDWMEGQLPFSQGIDLMVQAGDETVLLQYSGPQYSCTDPNFLNWNQINTTFQLDSLGWPDGNYYYNQNILYRIGYFWVDPFGSNKMSLFSRSANQPGWTGYYLKGDSTFTFATGRSKSVHKVQLTNEHTALFLIYGHDPVENRPICAMYLSEDRLNFYRSPLTSAQAYNYMSELWASVKFD